MSAPAGTPRFVYKIVPGRSLADASRDGLVDAMPIDRKDGYCHLSTADQLAETLALHFRGQEHLLILAVRTGDLGAALRWEPSRGGALFPHYYGPLPLSAVEWTAPVSVGPAGEVELPEAVV